MAADPPTDIQTRVVERRISDRAAVTVQIEYQTVDALFSEFTRNINEGGVFVETESPLEMEERVQLQFCLPGSDDPIKVTGRVAWVDRQPGSGGPGMGIEFEDLDAEARARIDELVKSLRPGR